MLNATTHTKKTLSQMYTIRNVCPKLQYSPLLSNMFMNACACAPRTYYKKTCSMHILGIVFGFFFLDAHKKIGDENDFCSKFFSFNE